VTYRQVTTLLGTIATLRPFACPADDYGTWGEGKDDGNPAFDGGVAAAAHSAMICTLSRLEDIMNDSTRWDLREAGAAVAMRESIVQQLGAMRPKSLPPATPAKRGFFDDPAAR
jgi:hypothetical protein